MFEWFYGFFRRFVVKQIICLVCQAFIWATTNEANLAGWRWCSSIDGWACPSCAKGRS